MAYDGAGYWNPNAPGQHSSLAFAKSNTEYWLKRGLPRAKPFWASRSTATVSGRLSNRETIRIKVVVAAYPGAEKVDQVGSTIWYNGVPTIRAKSQYVVDQGLAGIMIWSLDADVPGERSLLTAIHETLTARPKR
jgi:GH18 family chitinase